MQGLISAWRRSDERAESRAHHSKSATLKRKTQNRLKKSLAKGDVYCTVKCEGQVKRSAVARGHESPVWKEDMAFKSVQISSELQVTRLQRSIAFRPEALPCVTHKWSAGTHSSKLLHGNSLLTFEHRSVPICSLLEAMPLIQARSVVKQYNCSEVS